MRCVCLCIILLTAGYLFGSNPFPEPGRVYSDKEIPRVDISINPVYLETILSHQNLFLDDLYPAQFKWIDSQGTEVLDSVGFRLRGNTSRLSAKKSFKIKFKGFGGDEFYGLSDLNLNGEHNDPSVVRSRLAWDLYKMAGVPSPRANHVELYINGEYFGLYANVEHIDKDYLKIRYQNPTGNLYKMTYGCDFLDRGQNPDNYKFGDPRVFELKNNEEQDDYSNLANFMRILNDVSNPDYRCDLESVFDVDLYLRALALEVLLGHFDSPAFNKNNGYLYEDPTSGQIKYIPFDLDNTFGIIWGSTDMSEINIYQWQWSNPPLRIYKMMMTVPEYRYRFGYYINKFVGSFFNGSFLYSGINDLRALLKPYIDRDKYYTYSYGFDPTDFWTSFNYGLGEHVPYGIKEFISKRSSTALAQLQDIDILPVMKDHKVEVDTESFFTVHSESWSDQLVYFYYNVDNTGWMSSPMRDDGIFPDSIPRDNVFTVSLPIEKGSTVSYYFEAVTTTNRMARLPGCESENFVVTYQDIENSPLYINEVMAANDSYPDEYGEADDWIELYNPGPERTLTNLFLTDDRSNPEKWKVPAIRMPSNGYALFWADDAIHQGSNHVNFKLNKTNEEVILFYKSSEGYLVVDEVTITNAVRDVSFGRFPDGTGPFIDMFEPTPNASNVNSPFSGNDPAMEINIFPNPATDRVYIDSDSFKPVRIMDIHGRSISFDQNMEGIDVSEFIPGLYLIYFESDDQKVVSKFIKN